VAVAVAVADPVQTWRTALSVAMAVTVLMVSSSSKNLALKVNNKTSNPYNYFRG
jgi:hypothetical protein